MTRILAALMAVLTLGACTEEVTGRSGPTVQLVGGQRFAIEPTVTCSQKRAELARISAVVGDDPTLYQRQGFWGERDLERYRRVLIENVETLCAPEAGPDALFWHAAYPPEQTYVNSTSGRVNVRRGPGLRFLQVAQLQPGEGGRIQTCALDLEWCEIAHGGAGGASGWVRMDLVQPL